MAGVRFEWDSSKDEENQSKHRVSFFEAQFAFADPKGVIAQDLSHSSEKSVITVLAGSATAYPLCALLIDNRLFVYSGPDIGVKAGKSMSAKIRYTNEPLGKLKIVPDFLPKPEDLVLRDEGVKVTIALSKRSVDFFKREAEKYGAQYQRMIRRLLDEYARYHAQPGSHRSTRPRKPTRAG
jgi:uncharacterized DUF497 family protein